MHTANEIAAALRKFVSWVDTDGTKMALINLIARGEIEIAGIDEGGFIFTLAEEVSAQEGPADQASS